MTADVSHLKDREWMRLLVVNEEGKVTKDIGNAVVYLLNHHSWKGCLSYDEFSDNIFWSRLPPAFDEGFPSPTLGAEVAEGDAIYVHHWFARTLGVKFAVDALLRAIEVVAKKRKVCPPRDYLSGLTWDGTPRLEKMFATYFGTEPSAYASCIALWWMVSAVARIFEPGCKADCILILQGKQGAKKSTALQVLGGKWYSNSLPDVTSKDAVLSMSGSWIIEIPELEAMNRSSKTAFKDFAARTFDKIRPPYGRFQITRQRMCVMAGTTNEEAILGDSTGDRRYWPMHVAAIDIKGLRADVDQLWAEAVVRFNAGDDWWPSTAMAEEVLAQQDARFSDDVWTIPVASWLENWEQTGGGDFTTADILSKALGLDVGKHDIPSGMRISKILRRLNYERAGRKTIGDRRFSVYTPKRAALRLREPGEDDE